MKNVLNNNKRITVPITFPESNEIKPSEILDFNELEVGFYNILTPKDEFHRFIDPNEIDLIIIPGLAFDRKGYRVGKISGIKKEADIIKSFKDYIVTIEDGTQLIFIDEEFGKNLGVFKDD